MQRVILRDRHHRSCQSRRSGDPVTLPHSGCYPTPALTDLSERVTGLVVQTYHCSGERLKMQAPMSISVRMTTIFQKGPKSYVLAAEVDLSVARQDQGTRCRRLCIL
jgi:hypothetical protein